MATYYTPQRSASRPRSRPPSSPASTPAPPPAPPATEPAHPIYVFPSPPSAPPSPGWVDISHDRRVSSASTRAVSSPRPRSPLSPLSLPLFSPTQDAAASPSVDLEPWSPLALSPSASDADSWVLEDQVARTIGAGLDLDLPLSAVPSLAYPVPLPAHLHARARRVRLRSHTASSLSGGTSEPDDAPDPHAHPALRLPRQRPKRCTLDILGLSFFAALLLDADDPLLALLAAPACAKPPAPALFPVHPSPHPAPAVASASAVPSGLPSSLVRLPDPVSERDALCALRAGLRCASAEEDERAVSALDLDGGALRAVVAGLWRAVRAAWGSA
ncbi:hypothetical protein WOLCODRAFT_162051 [Wolfiporia cocos MD-104 SS10]|uniref:Uncharacterized protein n=1 Tax=Wolfiporia cocos (strain MD-104) TaxID=742152 RepID=A0A2H3JJJ8_WOLCO|nr:hypothetical protein WOLCODRAFT_162051 [Wolfiporia cocos MD-104 SS10]